ncbi:DUF998 domain-containing protein [Parvularcula sp. LCG005]|uniref:DUF998 domain-containing protein n=1 Tax=Parvularcula sp. LCG005 TaxID=3078805 RepID=UPI0029436E5D|nr:DUF998 domain-containing protein [Parvularcula sp. LCG005]WOI53185.1 DUF998 domain-containing protein [Parvularcula sp. LCG005]
MSDTTIRRTVHHHAGLAPYRVLAGFALFGAVLTVILDMAMWFIIDGYNPMAQTISELAAGPHSWIQDLGICTFAVGIACLAIGFTLRSDGDRHRNVAMRTALGLLSAVILTLALYNEYGDGDFGGVEIHLWLVGAIYLLVPAIFWLLSGLPAMRRSLFQNGGKAVAVAWLLLAPLFFVVPDTWDGAFERVLAMVMIAGVVGGAFYLYRQSDHAD